MHEPSWGDRLRLERIVETEVRKQLAEQRTPVVLNIDLAWGYIIAIGLFIWLMTGPLGVCK